MGRKREQEGQKRGLQVKMGREVKKVKRVRRREVVKAVNTRIMWSRRAMVTLR